jgi:predicted RNase H-like nuclease
MKVAGVDGCRGGWCTVLWDLSTGVWQARVLPSFTEVAGWCRGSRRIGVDMPIGLADRAESGGRACDRHLRALLGANRGASVFAPPVRAALDAQTYGEALAINRDTGPGAPGISIQCYNLFPRLRELDAWITPARQRRVREAHPEFVFWRLNARQPVAPAKRSPKGRGMRVELLARAGFSEAHGLLACQVPRGAARDDLIDACALAVAMRDLILGCSARVGARGGRDAKGLSMEIHG